MSKRQAIKHRKAILNGRIPMTDGMMHSFPRLLTYMSMGVTKLNAIVDWFAGPVKVVYPTPFITVRYTER